MNGRSSRNTRPPPLKARLREAAHDAILEAVEAVLLERGIDGASIAAIAERAGVAVGTLYNYFPDRDAMISALFRARRAEIAPRLVEAAKDAEGLPFEERLRAYVRGVFAAFDERRAFVRIAIALDQQGRRVDRDSTLIDQFARDLELILRDHVPAQRAGDYARFFVGAMRGYKHGLVEHDEPADPDFLVDTFLHGILP